MFVGKGQLQNPSANFTGHRGTSMPRGSGGSLGLRQLRHSPTGVSDPRDPAGHLTLRLTVEIISMLHLHPAFKSLRNSSDIQPLHFLGQIEADPAGL